MPTTHSVAGSTLSVTQTVALWTVFLPELTDIKRQTPGRNPDFADDVRYAELTAGAASFGLALLVSRLEKSWTPMYAWMVCTAVLFVAYEVTLRNPGKLASVTVLHPHNNQDEEVSR